MSMSRACVAVTFASALLGCATPHMLPPIHPTSVWRVEGHTVRKQQRDHTLRVGPFLVDDVAGTRLAAVNRTAYGRAPDLSRWDYTFRVHAQPSDVVGACTEEVDQARWHGMGARLLSLTCTCRAGDRTVAELELRQERGSLRLHDDEGYELGAAHLSARGEQVRSVLGYRIVQGRNEGGVEVQSDARAYVPRALPSDRHAALACAYAALLLFREVK